MDENEVRAQFALDLLAIMTLTMRAMRHALDSKKPAPTSDDIRTYIRAAGEQLDQMHDRVFKADPLP